MSVNGLIERFMQARLESFVDDPGHEVVLHSRVFRTCFLPYDAAESVDFVDKKDIALLHLR